MTKTQESQQCHGPHRPTKDKILQCLNKMPHHLEVSAISINGQTGTVIIEFYHEGLEDKYEFDTKQPI